MSDASAIPSASVTRLERLLHWRLLPVMAFLGLMLALTLWATVPMLWPLRPVRGLPDDPDVAAARGLLHGRVVVPAGGLRFSSALTGEAPFGALAGPAQATALGRARVLLEGARRRRARDERLVVARAHVDLALRRHEPAARGYRYAIDRHPRYPEARLGLGIALANLAESEPDQGAARGLRLESLAQFTAVVHTDEVYEAALYNRAVMLARVGRFDQAAAAVVEYKGRDSVSVWARQLVREVAEPER